MGVEELQNGLEIGEDLRQQAVEWRLQRVVRAALGLVVVAGALGLLGGGGPMSRVDAGTEGGLRVRAHRFLRAGADETMRIELPVGAGETPTLTLSRAFVRAVRIEQVVPPPASSALGEDGLTLVFNPPAGGGTAEAAVHFRPEETGAVLFEARSPGGAVRVRHFVFP